MEVPEGTGKGEWHRRQAGGGGRVGHRGRGGGVAAAAQGRCGDRVGGRESGPDTAGQGGVAGAGMGGEIQGGSGGTPVVGLAYDVASGPGGGGSQSGMSGEESCQEEDRRRVACAHSSLGRH